MSEQTEQAQQTHSSASDSLLETRLAERLKTERKDRDWSVAELSKRAGVSRAMIAKLEAGEASPTAALLGKLSGAFGLSLSELLARAEGPGGQFMARADQPVWHDPETGYLRRTVSARGAVGSEIVEVELPPGSDIPFPASSYRFITQQMLILDGTMEFHEGDHVWQLAPGDWLELGPPRDCRFANPSDRPCRYLVILVKSERR